MRIAIVEMRLQCRITYPQLLELLAHVVPLSSISSLYLPDNILKWIHVSSMVCHENLSGVGDPVHCIRRISRTRQPASTLLISFLFNHIRPHFTGPISPLFFTLTDPFRDTLHSTSSHRCSVAYTTFTSSNPLLHRHGLPILSQCISAAAP